MLSESDYLKSECFLKEDYFSFLFDYRTVLLSLPRVSMALPNGDLLTSNINDSGWLK